MASEAPIIEIRGRFEDEREAQSAADALNRWFRWILDGSELPAPEIFEPLGVETAAYAWTLGEDVDWEVGPHARVVGDEVRIALDTRDTHLHLLGLLRRLGARDRAAVRE